LPPAVRRLQCTLAPSAPATILGRQHQPDMFETLVRETGLLAYVSRSHFRLEASEEGGRGRLLVTNLSQNVAVVAQRPLHHGESIEVDERDTLSFAHTVPKTSSLEGQLPGEPQSDVPPVEPCDVQKGLPEVSIVPFLTLRLLAGLPPEALPPCPSSASPPRRKPLRAAPPSPGKQQHADSIADDRSPQAVLPAGVSADAAAEPEQAGDVVSGAS
jgi:hypothetical protein